jgi:hypothetical protein
MEQNDEWLVGRHYFGETSLHKLLPLLIGSPLPLPVEAAS